jgi:hypothetical protein
MLNWHIALHPRHVKICRFICYFEPCFHHIVRTLPGSRVEGIAAKTDGTNSSPEIVHYDTVTAV